MPIIHIHMISGRSIDQKRTLVSKVTAAVTESIGTPEETVSIVLHESELENLSKGGLLRADSRKQTGS